MGDLDALRRGVVQIIEVPSLAHLPEKQAATAEGIRSYAVVPLLAGGTLIGSLNLSTSEPGGPSVGARSCPRTSQLVTPRRATC
jgi:GAF domain-containing protein